MGEIMNNNYILTVIAKDKPGIVRVLSDIVLSNNGSWLEASLSRLGGQFAGIISVKIPNDQLDNFKEALSAIVEQGISAKINVIDESTELQGSESALIMLEANDRHGIIDEISSILAEKGVNVEKLTSVCESASMAGYELFKAEVKVLLPVGLTVNDLQTLLEQMSDDLMVTIH